MTRILVERLAMLFGRNERFLRNASRRPFLLRRLLILGKRHFWTTAIVSGSDAVATRGLRVPYAEPSAALGLEGFVLGINDEKEHRVQQNRIKHAIDASAAGHATGLERLDAVMRSGVRAGEPFDLDALVREAVTVWASELLGVAADAGPGLIAAGQAVVDRTYLANDYEGPMKPDKTAWAGRCQAVVGEYRIALTQPFPAGSIGSNLTGTPDEVKRDVIGLTGGPTALTVKAAVSIVQWALGRRRRWTALSCAAHRDDFRARLRTIVEEVPPEYFLPRHAADETARVLVSGWGDRKRHDTPFGSEPHLCLGEQWALDALAALLRPVFFHRRGRYVPGCAADVHRGLWVKLGSYRRGASEDVSYVA